MSTVEDSGYGRRFEGWYDRIFPKDAEAEQTAAQLAALHPGRGLGTLELGVGTGRIAVPLTRLVGPVHGVDSSPEMLAALAEENARSGTDVVGVHGDIRDYTDDRRYGLVYCVCATLSMLLTADEQGAAVERAAQRLAPGGVLVVETHNKAAVTAAHGGRPTMTAFAPYPEPGTGLLTHATLLPDDGRWHCSHVWFEKDGTSRVGSETVRLTDPADLDSYAARCNLVPRQRWGDWDRTPYTGESLLHIVVYERAS